MLESEKFVPPYPRPHASKLSALWRFTHGWNSWIHTLFEKSYSMQMGHVRTRALNLFVVNDLRLVREITEARADDFPKHSLQHEILCPLLGDNIFTANGDAWKRQRELVDPGFSHTRLENSLPAMKNAVAALIARLHTLAGRTPVAIDALMTHVTGDIIFRTILSQSLDEAGADAIFEDFRRYQDISQKIITCRIYGLPDFWLRPGHARAAKAVRKHIAPLVARRYYAHNADSHSQDDILGSLLEAVPAAGGTGFTLDELTNQVAMLFLAGHETSASALTWSLYLLARCPHLQDELRGEIDAVCPLGWTTPEALKRLVGVRNVFKEAMRLYPPVSFLPREPRSSECLRDKQVGPGDMVTIAPWLLQRHRAIWSQPDRFDPDRFCDPNQAPAIRAAFIPFGRGPRVCVGQGFAMQEGTLVLAEILRNFRLVATSTPEPVNRITLRSKSPIRLVITPV